MINFFGLNAADYEGWKSTISEGDPLTFESLIKTIREINSKSSCPVCSNNQQLGSDWLCKRELYKLGILDNCPEKPIYEKCTEDHSAA